MKFTLFMIAAIVAVMALLIWDECQPGVVTHGEIISASEYVMSGYTYSDFIIKEDEGGGLVQVSVSKRTLPFLKKGSRVRLKNHLEVHYEN